MSIQRIAKDVGAEHKSVTLVYQERENRPDRIRLIYRGFGAANLSGGETNSGLPLQKKNTSVTAGDIIEIRYSDLIIDKVIDRNIPTHAVEYVNGGDSMQQYCMHAPSKKEIFHVNVEMDDSSILDIDIPFVVLEPIAVQNGELAVGIDFFIDVAGWGANNKDTGIRRWTKELESNGLSFAHSTLLGGTWLDGFNDFLVGKIDGKFNLQTLDQTNAARYEGDQYNRQALGIIPAVDIFDQIGFKYDFRFDRSPLAASNNCHGEIIPNELFSGSSGQPPCEQGKMQAHNKFQRIVNHQCGDIKYQNLYKRHTEMMQGITPPGAWICTGTELAERSVERNILAWLDRTRNPVFINGEYLWLGEYSYDKEGHAQEGWKVTQHIGNHIIDDPDLGPKCSGVRIHHAHPDTLLRQLDWIEPLVKKHKLKLWVSTDGTQPRLTNAQKGQLYTLVNNVMNKYNIVALSYKTTSIEDTTQTIKYLGGLM